MARLRFHARWGWRMLAREPVQHGLIVLLLAAVTLSLTFVAALLWQTTRPPVSSIGPAATELLLSQTSEQSLAAGLREVREEGLASVVVLEETVRFPGRASEIALRNQPLRGALGGRPFTVLDGRLPRGPHEMAVTRSALDVLGAFVGPRTRLGSRVKVTSGQPLKIVGVVRDPRDFDAAVLYVDDAVKLAPSSASVYTRASIDRLASFQTENPAVLALVPVAESTTEGVVSLAVLLVLAALIVAGLLASVSYAISARRRLREYGMLGALGATSRQITTTITAVGVVNSLVAAVPGALAGYALATVGTDALESFLGRDLASSTVPPWIAIAPMLMMVVVSTGAARRPARAIARIAVVDALAGRRPPRAHSGRSVRWVPLPIALAAFAFVVGSARELPILLFCGPLLALVALLMLARPLVRLVGHGSAFGPTPWRFALRDLARRPASSAALLAGLTALLTAPATIAVLTASADQQRATTPPNLPANMLLVDESVGGLNGFSAVDPKHTQARALLTRLQAMLPEARTSEVTVPVGAARPVNRSEFGPKYPVFETMWAVQQRQRPPRVRSDTSVWIATPRLLSLVTDRSDAARPGRDVRSDNPHSIAFRTPTGPPVGHHVPSPLGAPPSGLLAEAWVSPRFAKRHGWRGHVAGWILVNDGPIPASVARAAAGYAFPDFEVTAHEEPASEASSTRLLLLGTCLAALVLALAALALERVELQRDARIYSAIGARGRLLRLMAATRTGVLAFVASLGAIAVGYAVWFANHLFSSEEPPVAMSADLLLVAVALPVMLGAVSAAAQALRGRASPSKRRPFA